MHQVQFGITQMFDGVTQVLGEDVPFRVFGCGVDNRATLMRSRSGTARQGSGPIGSACRERYQSAISSERLCTLRHSQTLLPYPPVFNCDLERSDNSGAAVFMRRGQTHQERKDLLRQVLRNFIVRLQFLSDRGAHGAAPQLLSCKAAKSTHSLIAGGGLSWAQSPLAPLITT